ncbi:MAG: ATP-binding protein [Thermoplasmata archaeon]|nr:ATP-binding protein [Thermoplasmata archaeon]
MIRIGKSLQDESDAYLDDDKSRVILICGKRGSGKSYTMGVMIEELLRKKERIILVIDPMGIFHTMCLPNTDQEELLWNWGMHPEGSPIRVLVPGNPEERYGGQDIVAAMEKRGVRFVELRLNPSDISPEGWCETFGVGINDPMGIAIHKAVNKCRKKYGGSYFLDELVDLVEYDTRAASQTKDALTNRLEMAKEWGMFENEKYRLIEETLDPNSINILDLSTIESGRYGRRPLILDTLARSLFKRRSIARRKEELGLASEMKRLWMFIDEAQQFAPAGKSSISKETLVRWVKEGRQPGLSLVASSQQPSAITMEVLSQCDAVISHSLTTAVDKDYLNRLTKDYMRGELKTYINKIARTGEAVFVDDDKERVDTIRIQPRKSSHGGKEEAS